MSKPTPKVADDTAQLRAVAGQPLSRRLPVYLKLSGPGWIQSAITLGGGSLSGSLYLGVIGGFGLLWLQPIAMIMGIIMLCAVGYVTMATRRETLGAINEYVNPVLGYGWAIASLLSCMVWAMPQYSLSLGVLQQNLLPGLLGEGGPLSPFMSKLIPTILILAFSTYVTWNYAKGGRGVKIYEAGLKLMVGMIVICFAGVIFRIAFSPQGLDWGAIMGGFIPDFSLLNQPAHGFRDLIASTPIENQSYWNDFIVRNQRDVMVAAAATAVGINMTLLFPYSILRRGWGREFNGLMRFDLGTGMFIPFTVTTSFVVIAAASQFHTVPEPGLLPADVAAQVAAAPARVQGEYNRLIAGLGTQVTETDRQLAAMLVTRDAFQLAKTLEPLTGAFFGRVIFGLGVLGMTLSTITVHMLISGMALCAMLKKEQTGWTFRIGTLFAATGTLGPFIWSGASFYLAVPTSIFGFILMPLAYLVFMLMMNQRKLLGDAMPTGGSRIAWNTLMGFCLVVVSAASAFMLWTKGGPWGMGAAAAFLIAAAAVDVSRRLRPKAPKQPEPVSVA